MLTVRCFLRLSSHRSSYVSYGIASRLYSSTIEEWKKIQDFPNYEASSFGNIRNIKTNYQRFIDYDKFRANGVRPTITLHYNKIHRTLQVPRLILSTFRPIQNLEDMQVNHVDGDWANNKLSNLEWVTQKENIVHAFENGLNHPVRTPVMMINELCGTMHKFVSIKDCMEFPENKEKAITRYMINYYCVNRSIKHGYQWLFSDSSRYQDTIESNEGEEWKILQYGIHQKVYYISNQGRLKVKYKKGKEKLKAANLRNGYLYYNLFRDGKNCGRRVHRLVAQHFVPNPANKSHVDHIDGNKLNCDWRNLQWVTAKENMNNELTKKSISKTMRKVHERRRSILARTEVNAAA